MRLRVLLLDDMLREAREVFRSALAPFLPSGFSFGETGAGKTLRSPAFDLHLKGLFEEPVVLELRHNPTDRTSDEEVLRWLEESVVGREEPFDLVFIDDNWGGGESDYAGQRRLLPFLFERLSASTMFCLLTQHWDDPDRTGGLAALLLREPFRGTGRLSGLNKRDIGGFLILINDVIGRAILRQRARVQGADVVSPLPKADRCGEMIGCSVSMREVYRFVQKASGTDLTVLIRGETGTGKGLVAKAIHEASQRSAKGFVHVPCAELPRTLLESALFGHERGAWTGADARKQGRFELADGGTIFLDEVGDFSNKVQVKLLRVLEEGTFERVGGTETLRSGARVIAATHRDLNSLMQKGRFRRDLYYRLNVLQCFVPPLRERPEDISLLIPHFIEQAPKKAGKAIRGISEEAMKVLLSHSWPGNVRELEHCIQRMVVMAESETLGLAEMPEEVRGGTGGSRESGRPGPNERNVGPDETRSETEADRVWRALQAGQKLFSCTSEGERVLVTFVDGTHGTPAGLSEEIRSGKRWNLYTKWLTALKNAELGVAVIARAILESNALDPSADFGVLDTLGEFLDTKQRNSVRVSIQKGYKLVRGVTVKGVLRGGYDDVIRRHFPALPGAGRLFDTLRAAVERAERTGQRLPPMGNVFDLLL